MSLQSDIFAPVGQPVAFGSRDRTNVQKLCLRLENNPISTFYKDEGGKSNFLTASCTVAVENDESSFPIGNLRISPRLVYECGGEIEDEEQIFNVLSVEPKTITSTNEIFTVNFRIEKVSRRKDGKKFRLRFDINQQRSQLLDYISVEDLKSIETQAVTVLSKRKSHSHHQHSSSPDGSHTRSVLKSEENSIRRKMQSMKIDKNLDSYNRKRRMSINGNNESNKSATVTKDFLLKLVENMKSLEMSVQQLSERVGNLERRLAPTTNKNYSQMVGSPPVTRGQRVHSLMFDEGLNDYVSHSPTQIFPANHQPQPGIKRNGSSTQELYEFLTNSNFA